MHAINDKNDLSHTPVAVDSAQDSVRILDYAPALLPYFKAINEQWISSMFQLEATDREVLDNPERLILQPGGRIFFASHASHGVVGTCALLKKGPDEFELTKMGVLEHARGLKVGEALLQEVIRSAQEMHIENLFLLTNKICEAAIHLYRKHGFFDDAAIMRRFGPSYQRCNVAMRYRFE